MSVTATQSTIYALHDTRREATVSCVATIGGNVRRFRKEAGFLLVKDFAEALGWPPSRVSELETNRFRRPTSYKLEKVAVVLTANGRPTHIGDFYQGVTGGETPEEKTPKKDLAELNRCGNTNPRNQSDLASPRGAHGEQENADTGGGGNTSDSSSLEELLKNPVAFATNFLSSVHDFRTHRDNIVKELDAVLDGAVGMATALKTALVSGQITVSADERPARETTIRSPGGRVHGKAARKSS